MSFVLEVRAQTSIKKDDEITTRYLSPWEGQPNRQLKIEKSWNFICNCLRCKDPSDLATYFSAIKCQQCTKKLSSNDNATNGTCNNLCNDISYNNGYLLPLDGQVLRTPWQCNVCGSKKSLRDIEDVLESLKNKLDQVKSEIMSIMSNQFSETANYVETSVHLLEEHIHPNHFLLFQLKKWFLELSFQQQTSLDKSKQQVVESILLNGVASTEEFSNKISFLELQMKYHLDVLKIVEMLDRGLTVNRAGHHKRLAQCRIELSRLKMLAHPEKYTKLQHMNQMKIAMSELKQVSLSFKYPEKK